MQRKTFAIIVLLVCAGILSATNQGFYWWNEPGDYDTTSRYYVGVPKTGTFKALVFVIAFPDDSICQDSFADLDTIYPTFYDSLIAPSVNAALTDSNYKWSITNFLYEGSWGQLEVTGAVNPGMNHRYIVAPENLSYYQNTTGLDSLIHDIIRAVDSLPDSLFDFSDYDVWPPGGDGYVDFVFYIHPHVPLTDDSGNYYPNEANFGVNGPDFVFSTNDSVSVCRCVHLGSTNSYYTFEGNPDNQLLYGSAMHLMAHELGHDLGLPDYYEAGRDNQNRVNPYAYSSGQGKYSVMQLGYYTKHAHLYSPWERIHLGWIAPDTIDTNSQNIRLVDFNTGDPGDDPMVYKIPIASDEYFLVTNHQQKTHWEDDYGYSFRTDIDTATAGHPNAKGVMIWHIKEDHFFGYGTHTMTSELGKWEDLECAEGLLNLYGNTDSLSPWGTEAGWDRIDRWCGGDAWMGWDSIVVNASSSHANDFFKPGYRTAFHSLTNPNSDAYNQTEDSLWGRFDCTYPSGSYGSLSWNEVTELGYRQNKGTHIGIEGIHYDTSSSDGTMRLCIRRSRIWTDEELAMDRTTQRKLIYSSDSSTYHFVYPSKGYIYYTRSTEPSEYWKPAINRGSNGALLGRGIWPAMTLDQTSKPIVV